jgi:hypothetical protein
MKNLLLVLITIPLIFGSCKELMFGSLKKDDDVYEYMFNGSEVVTEQFYIQQISITDDFYFSESIADSLFYQYSLTDSAGILMKEYNGEIFYNPVQIAQRALFFLSTYQITNDIIYLDWAEKYALKLIELSDRINQSLMFPYEFDFPLHGYNDFVMKAPWYSGMAQGQVLSLFSKLFSITNDNRYMEYSQQTFNSFFIEFDGFNNDNNWISAIDSAGYLWIEEYPFSPVNFTLNGFLFSIIGVHDFYKIKPEKDVYDLLNAVLTTAKYNLPKFRSVNDISYYCIAHKVQAKKYHFIHIEQIDYLYKMTNDDEFKNQSRFFSIDY